MFRSFVLMIQFLTRLPININIEFDKETISKGTLFFPFIGMIIGSIASLIYYLSSFINVDISSLLSVLAMVALTGGLHIDGLSDTADGFFSSRTREKVLEIMKDSRVGTFGVIVIVFDLLLKYVLIKNLNSEIAIIAIVLSCGLGRVASSMLLTFGKSARENGLGNMFMNNDTKLYFVSGTLIFSIIGLVIGKFMFIAALVSVLIFAYTLMKYSYKIIGGLTGDVCGAACELCEILSLICFMVVGKWI